MKLRGYAIAAIAVLAMTGRAHAAERTFATTYVSTATSSHGIGYDAGVDVSAGRYVRVTASGTLTLRGFTACGRTTGPNGCPAAMSFAKLATTAPTGALIAAFTSASGAPITAWAAVGDAAYIAVPSGAVRLVLRVNGVSAQGYGAFRVVADVVNEPAPSAVRAAAVVRAGGRHTQPTMRLVVGRLPQRSDVQYLLRRFGFSDTPATVTAVYKTGVSAWLTQQLNPAGIDDSAMAAYVEPLPFFGATTPSYYDNYENILQRRILQREIASKRQLLEKMTLHWLEHFAVSQDKVNSAAAMIQYEETVRTDALGNFATLVADVSVTPAMLLWLDNNDNDGSNVQANPPNENFGRELMQLYTVGTARLNPDATPVLDSGGNPVQTYTDTDVKQVAQALTGFQRIEPPNPGPTQNPVTLDTVKFYPARHAKGPFTIMGQTITDTGDPTIVAKVIASLAANPSTAPFQVKELLQRFVTENPSPGYISRIVAVWNANANDPNQLAKVMAAIAADPEFYANKGTVVKEPIEYAVDAIRALNGAHATPFTATEKMPYNSIYNSLDAMGQQHWFPPSVFSFYRPGDKGSMLTNTLLLERWNNGVSISSSVRTASLCATCDHQLDFTNLAALAGGTDAASVTGYLMDALADGGSPALQALLQNYLAPDVKANLDGAVWIVLTSPEYEVN
jgi:uncharacterized protein (DUF1800 family)